MYLCWPDVSLTAFTTIDIFFLSPISACTTALSGILSAQLEVLIVTSSEDMHEPSFTAFLARIS